MDIEETDVVVIGMGPGGEDAAGRLAEAGVHVTGVEAKLVGGECPYWGCVPSKMMIRAANLLAEARRIPGIAGTSTMSPDGPAADYRAVPRVTFTGPEIGSVGLTGAQTRQQGLAVRTGSTQLPSSARLDP